MDREEKRISLLSGRQFYAASRSLVISLVTLHSLSMSFPRTLSVTLCQCKKSCEKLSSFTWRVVTFDWEWITPSNRLVSLSPSLLFSFPPSHHYKVFRTEVGKVAYCVFYTHFTFSQEYGNLKWGKRTQKAEMKWVANWKAGESGRTKLLAKGNEEWEKDWRGLLSFPRTHL